MNVTFWTCYGLPIGRKHAMLTDGIDIQLNRNSLLYLARTVRYSFIHFHRLRVCRDVELLKSFSRESSDECNCTRKDLFAVHHTVQRCIYPKICRLTSSITGRELISLPRFFSLDRSTYAHVYINVRNE